jgi:hypothetical protein
MSVCFDLSVLKPYSVLPISADSEYLYITTVIIISLDYLLSIFGKCGTPRQLEYSILNTS